MDDQGMKFDSAKLRMELLSMTALRGTAAVLTFGAKKYAAHNWRKGIEYSRLIGAAFRHLAAFAAGTDIDEESGLPHIDHLACCVMFLQELSRTRKDLDDRYTAEPQPCPKAQVGATLAPTFTAPTYEDLGRIRDARR